MAKLQTVEQVLGNKLCVRTINALKREGVYTISDLRKAFEPRIKSFRNIGRKAYEELSEALEDYDDEVYYDTEIWPNL